MVAATQTTDDKWPATTGPVSCSNAQHFSATTVWGESLRSTTVWSQKTVLVVFLTDGVPLNAVVFHNGFMLSMILLVFVSSNVKNEGAFLK